MSYSQATFKPFVHRDIYTVSRLNFEVRDLLTAELPIIWIEGEISNSRRSGPGHLYFTLKDEDCQVSCAMFRNRNLTLAFTPEDGLRVLAYTKVDLYPTRGTFQLIVEHMEQSGEGALHRAFDALKARLSKEGLFNQSHKRDVPALPKKIGLVTSPTGAAVRDILSVLARRFPAIPVVIYPVAVQGKRAAEKIASMFERIAERADCDVLVLARGGGSLEELWAFNEEVLARAMFRCSIPIVTGIGHEIDFTIADFVADQRAATPSAAAELITPDSQDWKQRFAELSERLQHALISQIDHRRERLGWAMKRLIHPRRRLQDMEQRTDDVRLRLTRSVKNRMAEYARDVSILDARLSRHTPEAIVKSHQGECQSLNRRLALAIVKCVSEKRAHLLSLRRAFEAVGPQQTLERGYAIITREANGDIVRDTNTVKPGEHVRARLKSGSLTAQVKIISA